MKLYNVDTVIKGELLKKGLSIHHYVKNAYLAMRFMRSINFDSAYYIKTVTLTITDNKVDLPSDFIGIARIGIPNGQYVQELAPDQKLLNNDSPAPSDSEPVSGYSYWYPNYNKYGENLGGYFGYSILPSEGYKILFEDDQIYINNTLTSGITEILIQYHTDGISSGTPFDISRASIDPPPTGESTSTSIYIHPYAYDAMCAYMDWMSGDSSRLNDQLLEKRYYNELRKYRARIRPLTTKMIRHSLRGNYHASIKN